MSRLVRNDGLGGTVDGVVYNTPILKTSFQTQTSRAIKSLQFDNLMEPFPVLDKPKKGEVVSVTGGVITWISGDLFDIRWLPGTEILIGSPTSIAVFITSSRAQHRRPV